MALTPEQLLAQGQSPHAHELEAIEFLKRQLPGVEPYRLWALVELLDPTSGRLYELDAVVLGYHALYLIEIKSHPGTFTGDASEWKIDRGGQRHPTLLDNPRRTTNHKAKVLASLLARELKEHRVWVEPLVFLSHPEAKNNLAVKTGVVTRDQLARAITFGEVPGVPELRSRKPINKPTALALVAALKKLGLREARGATKIGEWQLGELLEEGPGYQDFAARNPQLASLERRVRVYYVPPGTSQERREQLTRAAEREARTLTALGDHPRMLRVHEFLPWVEHRGPCIVFEHLQDAVRLDVFLRANPTLSFDKRLRLVEQLAEGLDYCHQKQVLHRGLSPASVLVRALDSGDLDVRLDGFQLSSTDDLTSGTRNLTELSAEQALLYRAPELLENPTRATPESDLFSLGAVAFHIFTGRPPAPSIADRHALLTQAGYLSLAAASDDFAAVTAGSEAQRKSLDAVLEFATVSNPSDRATSVLAWLTQLLESLTAPEAPAPEKDPLEARPGERIGGLDVIALLGVGSTARVLRVKSEDGEVFALKIPHNHDAERRLKDEASLLERIHSDRIAGFKDLRQLGSRTCLLLDDAGETLSALLAREGSLSLDFARRWGDDLLLALEALEQLAIVHRDIKPGNLGASLGSSKAKGARHLTLFDFSLASVAPEQVSVGTPVYRDPMLVGRKRWDAAADRWSAAVTLHEMLTGVRPDAGEEAFATSGKPMPIEAERFDAAVRAPLATFFQQAFARDVSARHSSAEAMRMAWRACFAVPERSVSGAAPVGLSAAQATPETAVEALKLSPAARNALDRSGFVTVKNLLGLGQNTLRAFPGVGRETKKEIFEFVEALRLRFGEGSDQSTETFAPAFTGTDGSLRFIAGLSAEARAALRLAGLERLSEVAGAARTRIEHVLREHPEALKALRADLAGRGVTSGQGPATIEAWIETLFTAARKREQAPIIVRQLFGLDAPTEPAPDAATLAKRRGTSRQAIYIALGKCRDLWKGHPSLEVLTDSVESALEALGGVGGVDQVAQVLATIIPHAPSEDGGRLRRAEALVRVAVEVPSQLKSTRLHERLWVASTQAHLDAARALGALADRLAELSPLAAPLEVQTELTNAVEGTPLSGVPFDRLVAIATGASEGAARSARLEIYPRAMPAERALRLSSGALAAKATPVELVRLVSARYPEARPLPPRPELDGLVAELGYEWKDPHFIRKGAVERTEGATAVAQRPPTTHTSNRPPPDAEALEAEEFDERLRLAAEQGSFRVLDVPMNDAEKVLEVLQRRLNATVRDLEAELVAAAFREARAQEVDAAAVLQADREGRAGSNWALLCRLMREAARQVTESLCAVRGRVLLTHPGLLARYELTEVLPRLFEASQRDDGPAIFLVVPSQADPGPPRIHGVQGSLEVPLTSPSQRMTPPRSWLENQNRGRAA